MNWAATFWRVSLLPPVVTKNLALFSAIDVHSSSVRSQNSYSWLPLVSGVCDPIVSGSGSMSTSGYSIRVAVFR